ncbi:hypothetical protein VTK26DRAFT_6965 [Humicola hyalothermophila]
MLVAGETLHGQTTAIEMLHFIPVFGCSQSAVATVFTTVSEPTWCDGDPPPVASTCSQFKQQHCCVTGPGDHSESRSIRSVQEARSRVLSHTTSKDTPPKQSLSFGCGWWCWCQPHVRSSLCRWLPLFNPYSSMEGFPSPDDLVTGDTGNQGPGV